MIVKKVSSNKPGSIQASMTTPFVTGMCRPKSNNLTMMPVIKLANTEIHPGPFKALIPTRRHSGEGNGHILVIPLTIATKKRDSCLTAAGTSENNLNIQGNSD